MNLMIKYKLQNNAYSFTNLIIVIQNNMKKIVFVQKDSGSSYDPVSTFFANKKIQSATKPIKTQATQQAKDKKNIVNQQNKIQTNKDNSMKSAGRPSSALKKQNIKEVVQYSEQPYFDKKEPIIKQKAVTGIIGRKGEHLPSSSLNKDQCIYLPNKKKTYQSRIDTGLKKNSINDKKKQINMKAQQNQLQSVDIQNQSKQTLPAIHTKVSQQMSTPAPPSKNEDLSKLKKRIKQLQQSEKYLQAKLDDHQQKQQKYVKNEQKLNKMLKESKSSVNDTKDLKKKLSEKQDELKKLLSKEQIPYNRKRQVLLINKITQLKRINKQLTLRIKNYKGTDLVEISVGSNKADILNEYQHQGDQNKKDYGIIQSLAYRIIGQITEYISYKNQSLKKNGVHSTWNQQKKLLLRMMETSKNLSLHILQNTQSQLKLPSSNQECVNLYNQIEQIREAWEPVISKHQLNFTICQQNIQIINQLQQNQSCQQQVKDSLKQKQFGPQKRLCFKKVQEAIDYFSLKFRSLSQIYEKNLNWMQTVIAQNLAYIAFVNANFDKFKTQVCRNAISVDSFLKQGLQLVQSGNKQSVILHFSQNINQTLQDLQKISKFSKSNPLKSLSNMNNSNQ